jgi:hypothetical protein
VKEIGMHNRKAPLATRTLRNAKLFLAIIVLVAPALTHAYGWVYIADVSKVQYQLSPDGRLYFRNLNAFNSAVLGCCYNYWIDTNGVHGKNIYALFLSKQATGKGLILGVPDAGATGPIDYAGEWW